MSAQDTEAIRAALGGEHAWRGGVEEARRVVAEAHAALDRLVARLEAAERERDEAWHRAGQIDSQRMDAVAERDEAQRFQSMREDYLDRTLEDTRAELAAARAALAAAAPGETEQTP